MWIPVGELEGEGRKDCLKIAPVLEVSRAEERGTQPPRRKAYLRECLGNGRFPRPRKAIQPEDLLTLSVHQPELEVEEDLPPRSLQAPLSVPGTVTSFPGVTHPVEKREVHRFLFIGHDL